MLYRVRRTRTRQIRDRRSINIFFATRKQIYQKKKMLATSGIETCARRDNFKLYTNTSIHILNIPCVRVLFS